MHPLGITGTLRIITSKYLGMFQVEPLIILKLKPDLSWKLDISDIKHSKRTSACGQVDLNFQLSSVNCI